MLSAGKKSIEPVSLKDLQEKVSEADIAATYLGVTHIPCVINSPLRQDRKPSFGIYTRDGVRVYYVDFSNKSKGNIYSLLGELWGIPFEEVLQKLYTEMVEKRGIQVKVSTPKVKNTSKENSSTLECITREWRDYDIEYWASYGVPLEWLKYAEVYPVSKKIIIKEGNKYIFEADKYAYAFVERKEGVVTLKIYHPYNKEGYKWMNKHDGSTISLWTKIPSQGPAVCVCASLKDALCLWANIGIPSIAIQGEGYNISQTAINELKRRFTRQFICLDNDKAGLEDAKKLTELTGFTNITLPQIEGAKDISDIYKTLNNQTKFQQIITNLFQNF
jgi:hypothetical protein